MSDEKTHSATQPPGPDKEAPAAGSMPFPEMMKDMMVRCGCRPEQWSAMWAMCCGTPPEQQEKHNAL